MDSNKIMWNIDNSFKNIYESSMTPLHSHTSVPQHDPQRWWVRKWSHDTRQNQFKTQHCAPGPAQSSHECVGAGFLAAASRCHGPVNATEPRRRCYGRVAKAPTRWPSLSMPAGEGSTGQSKNTGMIYPKRYNKICFNSSLPGQKGHNFTDDFSNEFTWIKSFILWFNFYWCLFLRAQLTTKSA